MKKNITILLILTLSTKCYSSGVNYFTSSSSGIAFSKKRKAPDADESAITVIQRSAPKIDEFLVDSAMDLFHKSIKRERDIEDRDFGIDAVFSVFDTFFASEFPAMDQRRVRLIGSLCRGEYTSSEHFDGLPPVVWSIANHVKPDVTKALLRNGANGKDRKGRLPLHHLASQGIEKRKVNFIVSVFKEDINGVDEDGNISLMVAAQRGNSDFMNSLMKAGANTLVRNKAGQTVVEIIDDNVAALDPFNK